MKAVMRNKIAFIGYLKNLSRALRLPFVTVSVLPFLFGSLLARPCFNIGNFFYGLAAVVFTHLSANLANDYADSLSGADWKDRHFYKFFGGSKLIQEGVLTEKFYLYLAVAFFSAAWIFILFLAKTINSSLIIVFYSMILLFSWAYSAKPLQLSYRKMGELVIFVLFGPVLVMGGYFIQTQIFPTREGFLLSLPFGFLTTAILYSNEVPDFTTDKASGKLNWVSLIGQNKAFVIYLVLEIAAFFSIGMNLILGLLSPFAWLSFLFVPVVFYCAGILRYEFKDKLKLMGSSGLTIALQAVISIILIGAVLW